MILLYLSPWALLLNKISATTGFHPPPPPPPSSLFSSFNSIRKAADAIWSTAHVKPISVEHKKHFKTIGGPSHSGPGDPRCGRAQTRQPSGAFTPEWGGHTGRGGEVKTRQHFCDRTGVNIHEGSGAGGSKVKPISDSIV